MCSSIPTGDYQAQCSVYKLFQAKLGGAGTYDALKAAGALSPFSIDVVVKGEPNKAIDGDEE